MPSRLAETASARAGRLYDELGDSLYRYAVMLSPTGPRRKTPFSRSERSGGGLGVTVAAALFQQAIRPDLLVHDRSSRVVVAIERYRRAHADAVPAALSELVPQYLDAVPEDPLTGQPLRYHATPDAYMVYSVGPDGNDDGGMLLRQTPPSAAVRFAPGADMGVRVLIRRP